MCRKKNGMVMGRYGCVFCLEHHSTLRKGHTYAATPWNGQDEREKKHSPREHAEEWLGQATPFQCVRVVCVVVLHGCCLVIFSVISSPHAQKQKRHVLKGKGEAKQASVGSSLVNLALLAAGAGVAHGLVSVAGHLVLGRRGGSRRGRAIVQLGPLCVMLELVNR